MALWLVVVVFAFLDISSAKHHWPNDLPRCCIMDEPCILSSANIYLKKYATDKSILGQTLEPLVITKLVLDADQRSLNGRLEHNNLELKGIQNAVITSVTFDPSTEKVIVNSTMDIDMTGQYVVDAKFLIARIQGSGDFHYKLPGARTTLVFNGKFEEKNKKKLWHVENGVYDLSADKLFVRLDNLFNGDKLLGDQINLVLNDNYKVILEDLTPLFKEGYNQAINSGIKFMVEKFGWDEILLPC